MQGQVGQSDIGTLKTFFAKGSRPVDVPEMMTFWKACSDVERVEFKSAIQKWDGKSEFVAA